MLVSKFLNSAALFVATPAQRSMLFAARAAMRCNPVSEPPSISPMTAALDSIANQRTARPKVPSVAALLMAKVESGTEAQVVIQAKAKKSGRKRKNEVQDGTLRKKSGGTRKRKAEPNAAIAEAGKSDKIPKNSSFENLQSRRRA